MTTYKDDLQAMILKIRREAQLGDWQWCQVFCTANGEYAFHDRMEVELAQETNSAPEDVIDAALAYYDDIRDDLANTVRELQHASDYLDAGEYHEAASAVSRAADSAFRDPVGTRILDAFESLCRYADSAAIDPNGHPASDRDLGFYASAYILAAGRFDDPSTGTWTTRPRQEGGAA